LAVIRREKEEALEVARQQDMANQEEFFLQTLETLYAPPAERPAKPASQVFRVAKTYAQKYEETPEPTTLLMIDEADRLKTTGLEQVRDIFDQVGIGVVLIGIRGLEKRLSRYPQLYSRAGFVHAFRPLSAAGVRDLFRRQWLPAGVILPDEGLHEEAGMASIIPDYRGELPVVASPTDADRTLGGDQRLVAGHQGSGGSGAGELGDWCRLKADGTA
jgi:AAA domain